MQPPASPWRETRETLSAPTDPSRPRRFVPKSLLASTNPSYLRSEGISNSSGRGTAVASPERLLPHGEENLLVPSPASSLGRGPPATGTRSCGSRPLHLSLASGKLWPGSHRPFPAQPRCRPASLPTPTLSPKMAAHLCPLQAAGTGVKAPSRPLECDGR